MMMSATQASRPVLAIGGYFAVSLTVLLMFKPACAWREFVQQNWFAAKVSLMAAVMLAILFTVLSVFALNILLVQSGAADLSGFGAPLGAVTQIGPVLTVSVAAGAGATLMGADLGARTIRKKVDGAHRGHALPSVGERVAGADASTGVGAGPSAGRQS